METALDNGYDMKIAIETLVVPTFTLPNYLPANSSAAQMRHLEKRIDKISKKNNDIGGKYEYPIPLYGISIGCSEAQDTSARQFQKDEQPGRLSAESSLQISVTKRPGPNKEWILREMLNQQSIQEENSQRTTSDSTTLAKQAITQMSVLPQARTRR